MTKHQICTTHWHYCENIVSIYASLETLAAEAISDIKAVNSLDNAENLECLQDVVKAAGYGVKVISQYQVESYSYFPDDQWQSLNEKLKEILLATSRLASIAAQHLATLGNHTNSISLQLHSRDFWRLAGDLRR